MNRLILDLSILAVGFACVPAFAQDIVPTRPGDGIPDFYYFAIDGAMPAGGIYAGEFFSAGSFVIDPDGSDFGLATIIVEGPPALGFDTMPHPASRAYGSAAILRSPTEEEMARHSLPGSIITQQEFGFGSELPLPDFRGAWGDERETYQDFRAMHDLELPSYLIREWAVGYLENSMQIGILSGTPLGKIPGHPEDVKDILTKGLVYEGGQSDQFGLVTFADGSGEQLRTYINISNGLDFGLSTSIIDDPPIFVPDMTPDPILPADGEVTDPIFVPDMTPDPVLPADGEVADPNESTEDEEAVESLPDLVDTHELVPIDEFMPPNDRGLWLVDPESHVVYPGEFDLRRYASPVWPVGYGYNTIQLEMAPGTAASLVHGQPSGFNDILTTGFVYEDNLGDQFGLVTFADRSGGEAGAPATVIQSSHPLPEPSTLTLLALSALCLAIHARRPYRLRSLPDGS